MKKIELINKLKELDSRGIYVVARRDIEKLFPTENEKALEKSLQRMVTDGLLFRVTNGLYINLSARSRNKWFVEEIAKALRPGCLSYVSLESMLSEYGLISQIPMNRMTLMTTGRSGVFYTQFGTIEFTHTKRSKSEIMDKTIFSKDRPLRIATKETALRDLYRTGRNINMLDKEEFEEP